MKFEKLNLDLFMASQVCQTSNVKGGAGPIEVDTYVVTSNRTGEDNSRSDGVECDTIDSQGELG